MTDMAKKSINLALELHQDGRVSEALSLYELLLSEGNPDSTLLYLLGTAYYQTHKLPEAEKMLLRAIELEPDNAGAYSNRGLALEGLGRLEEALECFDVAININPEFSGALSNRGSTLRQMARLDEALSSLDAAIVIRPDYAEAHYNKGLILQDLDRLLLAVESYDAAIRLNPNYAEAYCNRGNALRELNRLDEALSSYDISLNLNPNHAEANWNKSYLLLLLGKYEDGWRLYEWRRRLNLFQNAFRPQGNPLLPDTDLKKSETVFIYSEQGLGDTIQFCRFVKLLAENTEARIQFQVPKVLCSLMASLEPHVTLVTSDDDYPKFDYQTSVMSLPWLMQTSLESIPYNTTYLSASSETSEAWSRNLGVKTKPRVGIVWSGGTDHRNDGKRSLPLSMLSSILDPCLEWHAIQSEFRDSDRETLESLPNVKRHEHKLTTLDETAALIQQMDLVISVDTCVAHLAGALGKSVWVLLPFVPDFRWLINRDDSPWYSSARLYRQDATMQWEPVLGRIKDDLALHFE